MDTPPQKIGRNMRQSQTTHSSCGSTCKRAHFSNVVIDLACPQGLGSKFLGVQIILIWELTSRVGFIGSISLAFKVLQNQLSETGLSDSAGCASVETKATTTVGSAQTVSSRICLFLAFCTCVVTFGNQLATVPDVHVSADHISKHIRRVFWINELVWLYNDGARTINRVMMDHEEVEFIVTRLFIFMILADEFAGLTKKLGDPNLCLWPVEERGPRPELFFGTTQLCSLVVENRESESHCWKLRMKVRMIKEVPVRRRELKQKV